MRRSEDDMHLKERAVPDGRLFRVVAPRVPLDGAATTHCRALDRGNHASAVVPGKRLLLVEDNELALEILTFVLRSRGYIVSSAANGQEALWRLRAGPAPDCIVLDLRLPGMDGWQFRASQLADPALAGIPVLLLSGQPGLPQEAAALGAAGYLQKPVGDADLVAAVERCCRRPQPAPPEP